MEPIELMHLKLPEARTDIFISKRALDMALIPIKLYWYCSPQNCPMCILNMPLIKMLLFIWKCYIKGKSFIGPNKKNCF